MRSLSCAAIRPPTEVVEPTYTTTCDGSQNAARRAASARDVGCFPSSVRVGTRSIHLPTRVSSIGARGSGAVSSITNTPADRAGTGRPHTTGPSGSNPTSPRRVEAFTTGDQASGAPGDGSRGRRAVSCPLHGRVPAASGGGPAGPLDHPARRRSSRRRHRARADPVRDAGRGRPGDRTRRRRAPHPHPRRLRRQPRRARSSLSRSLLPRPARHRSSTNRSRSHDHV